MARRSVAPAQLSNSRNDWKMSPGIISNGLLFLTGMTGRRPDNTIAEDPEQQIRDAFTKISAVLSEAGLDMSHIVEMTTYHLDIHHNIDIFRTVRSELVSEPYPAWTAIGVAGFTTPGAIVEIRIVADATPD